MSEQQIPLPSDWTVQENRCVGYDFLFKGELMIQHPEDSSAIRKYIQIFHQQHVEKSRVLR